jgi:O-antigen ligase
MELFVLAALVARPALDGLHARGVSRMTDPPTVLGVLFVVVSVVWLTARWLQGRRHPRSVAGLAIGAFVLAAGLATLGSDAPRHSAAELVRLISAVLMFFVVDRLCEDTGRPDRFLLAVVAAAAVPVAVALLGPLGGVHRTEIKDGVERAISTFAQSNPFGHFLTIVVLVLAAYVIARPGSPRGWAIVALVPVLLALGLTYTRLAWVGAVAGLLVMIWVTGRRWVVPAILVGLFAFAVLSPEVGHRLDQLTAPNAAVQGSESGVGWRLGQWGDVAKLGDVNPVTGIGPDVVPLRLANHQPPHNDYLRAFVELGLVGLIAYLTMLVSLVGVAARAQRRAVGPLARTVALAFVGVVTAFLIASIAANLLGQVVLLWYVFALAAAAAWVGRHGVVRPGAAHPAVRLPVPVVAAPYSGALAPEPVSVNGG